MLEGNSSGEIDFGPSKRDIRVSERLTSLTWIFPMF